MGNNSPTLHLAYSGTKAMVNAPGNRKQFLAFDPEFDPEHAPVKFRLTYEGRLESNARAPQKHAIRKVFHPQLKRLWEVEPNLSSTTAAFTEDFNRVVPRDSPFLTPGTLADSFKRDGFRYVPLVNKHAELVASLDILYLRCGLPGDVLKGGDIDNRLKTLFDALTMPASAQELGGAVPEVGEDPFYVLLQDDRLVTQVTVETDTLLQPITSAQGRWDWNDARLVVTVQLRPSRVTMDNMHFA